MVPWFDWKTLGLFRLLALEAMSTPRQVAAPLGLSDSLAGRPRKWALSGLGFSLRCLRGARSFPVAELKPLLPLRVESWQMWWEEGDLSLQDRCRHH